MSRSSSLSKADSQSSRPKAVIFDIGRVIVRLDLHRAFGSNATLVHVGGQSAQPLSPEDIWKMICADARWQEWQEGRLSPAEWHEHLMHRLKLSLSYGEFRDAWNLVLDPEPILGENLFVQLKGRCQLALLSNTDPIHVDALEQGFTFARHFAVRIYSCSVGATKPSPAIYEAALDALGVPPQEALYVDDMREFVEAARDMGMDAIQFRDPRLLESELRLRGVL